MATAGLTIAGSLASCAPTYFAKYSIDGNKIKISKSEFVYLKGEVEKERDFILVQDKSQKFPICLKKENDNYTALLMMCTHRSCELNVGGRVYTCPCHGSEFDSQGGVITGPAQKSLKSFKTESDENHIYIYI